jgi:hypothetical protein
MDPGVGIAGGGDGIAGWDCVVESIRPESG